MGMMSLSQSICEYHVVEFHNAVPNDALDWLSNKFGEPDSKRWFYHNKKIYFANTTDHMLFLLCYT